MQKRVLALAFTLALAGLALVTGTVPGSSPVANALESVDITINETVSVGDSPGVFGPALITVIEVVSAGDAPGVFGPAQVTVSESVSAGDAPGVFGPASITVAESINVNDALPAGTPLAHSPLLSVPALSLWGALGMALLLGVFIYLRLRRRRRSAVAGGPG